MIFMTEEDNIEIIDKETYTISFKQNYYKIAFKNNTITKIRNNKSIDYYNIDTKNDKIVYVNGKERITLTNNIPHITGHYGNGKYNIDSLAGQSTVTEFTEDEPAELAHYEDYLDVLFTDTENSILEQKLIEDLFRILLELYVHPAYMETEYIRGGGAVDPVNPPTPTPTPTEIPIIPSELATQNITLADAGGFNSMFKFGRNSVIFKPKSTTYFKLITENEKDKLIRVTGDGTVLIVAEGNYEEEYLPEIIFDIVQDVEKGESIIDSFSCQPLEVLESEEAQTAFLEFRDAVIPVCNNILLEENQGLTIPVGESGYSREPQSTE